MALIQHYSTELSAYAGSKQSENTAIAKIIDDITARKRQEEDEKRYFNSLNDRLEELLRNLDGLESANKNLRDELNFLINNWGIDGENRTRSFQELDHLIGQLTDQNHRKAIAHAEAKIFDEQTRLIDRIASLFRDVSNSYQDRSQLLVDVIKRLEDQLQKLEHRLNTSNAQVKSHDDDYQNELRKFRSYLSEWSQVALEKQNLLNEIQTLREHYNLRLAYNQEEINEWKRLLDHMSKESDDFYRDYLETMKQQIHTDYEQMAKEQQDEVEFELKSRLKQIEEKIQMGLPIDEKEERRRREETQRFENRINEQTSEHERLQADYRILTEEIQGKRRIVQDLENEARNKAQKHADERTRLEQETHLTREEYYQLKDELDKLAYTLRFSIEEELKIYEALLNSLDRQKNVRPLMNISGSYHMSKTSVKTTTEMEHSTNYGIAQSMLGQSQTTTRANDRQQQQISIRGNLSESDEKHLQSKVRITRRYQGNILIKSVDVSGRFIDVENTATQSRDLTGWSIERKIDGRRIYYTFPVFALDSHKTVRIYGSSSRPPSVLNEDPSIVELLATNFPDWGTGKEMHTELFNSDQTSKASFEQTLIQD